MNSHRNYTLQGTAGARAMSVEDAAANIKASFEALQLLGAPLRGPWQVNYKDPIDVTDEKALRAHILGSPFKDDEGMPSPEDGYGPGFQLGDWQVPNSVVTDLGKFNIWLSPFKNQSLMTASVSLTFEGDNFTVPACQNAEELVKSFARIWRPENFAFTDDKLLALRRERVTRSRASGLPSWGYVSWVSDQVSRQLESVEGAATFRYGTGTLIVTDTWEAEQAADVWQLLLDTKRLRTAPKIQEYPPTFL
ncbi:hypothetical protein GCM10022198_22270 [Klugiella xanthotipulae]|uniref:Immunity protein 52 of polymorphic toxin system n=1 Tax=Klugiella xanthotipulae TaxID=244735 RepID=A0A543I610_9MICO|nr:hypothetical protein [Klugiella xanthotipulae]TQM65981.1 hypothetical protein FB466_0801 [Klugiella xanthotipulae]